ncbi:MAG: TIGR04211 family SH3 domain-containing protein [Pseudomonadota bacterium]
MIRVKRGFGLWLAVCGLSITTSAMAQDETVYVTDVLRLGLHAAADTSDRAFRSLESGQAMTVISRDRSFANVRLPDGTEGYVKAAYLVDEKPARLVVAEAEARSTALTTELDDVRARFSGSAARISELETALTASSEEVAVLSSQLETATAATAEFEAKFQQYGLALPLPMALAAFVVALILGFAAGFWWIDSRSRKRHGGFRIY